MTEKQYKLERWTDTSLYYSFPTGSVHQGIGYVIEKVEKDLNQLADENEQFKQTIELIIDTAEQNDVITKSELREIKKELKEFEE